MAVAEKQNLFPSATPSPDAERLYQRLLKVEVGKQVTYDDLTKTIGRDVRGPGYGVLQTARRLAHRRSSMVFAAVPRIGLENITDTQKVAVGSDLRPVRRMLKRKARIIAAVKDFGALTPDAKREHNVGLAVLGAMELMTRPQEVKRIRESVEIGVKQLSFDETIRLFSR